MAGKSKKHSSGQKFNQNQGKDSSLQVIQKYKDVFVKIVTEQHPEINKALDELNQDPKNLSKSKNLLSCACQVIYNVFDNKLININPRNHAKQIYKQANQLLSMLVQQYENAGIMQQTIELSQISQYSSKHKVSALIVNKRLSHMITIRLAYNQDCISFIKGTVERDEMPIDALIREIKEETNITINQSHIKTFVSFIYKDDIIRQYLVVLDDDDITKYARDGQFNKYEIKSVNVMSIQDLHSEEKMKQFIHIYQINVNSLIQLVNQWKS